MNKSNTRRSKTQEGVNAVNQNKVILNLIQDLTAYINKVRSRIKYGMTPCFINGKCTPRGFTARSVTPQCRYAGYSGRIGFTLIELLVVVLIIGILAAVALPQYQKAVEKSRATQAFALLKYVYDAQESFYLENGKYATKFNQLDIQMPWSGRTKWRTDQVKDTLSNEEWSLQIYDDGKYSSISLGLLKGSYRGGGFVIYTQPRPNVIKGAIYCVERDTNGIIFQQQRGNYCSKLWDGKIVYHSNPVIFSISGQ